MREIRNKSEGPTQLVVRSFAGATDNANEFTVLNIPGRNIFFIEDDRIVDVYVKRSEQQQLIASRKITKEDFEELYNPNNPKMRYIPGYKQKTMSEEK